MLDITQKEHVILEPQEDYVISEYAEVVCFTDTLSREEWLQQRKNGIGGSDVAAIVGASQYKSAYALWLDKVLDTAPTHNTNEAMEWGNALERIVAERFAAEYNEAVVAFPALLRSSWNRFMYANVDFFIVPANEQCPAGKVTTLPPMHLSELPDIIAILEVKTNGIVGKPNREWEDNGVPRAYELQGQHYSIVTGVQAVVFAALIGGQGLQVRGRLYNSATSNNALVAAEEAFWTHVITQRPPETDGSESTLAALEKQFPKSEAGVEVEADDLLAAAIGQYKIAKAETEAAESRAKELRAKIVAAIGEAETITFEGRVLATYKSNKDTTAVDTKNLLEYLEANHPELIRNYTIPKRGFRVLRVKGNQDV